MTENPYAPPQTPLDSNVPDTDEERLRRLHINREKSIKAVGFLFCLTAIAVVLAGLGIAIDQLSDFSAYQLLGAIVFVGIGAYMFFIGVGLWLLQRWAKFPAGIFAILCIAYGLSNPLLAVKIGGVFFGFLVIALIFSPKGEMVFSDRYKEIILATHRVKPRSKALVWIFFGLLVLCVIALIAGTYGDFIR